MLVSRLLLVLCLAWGGCSVLDPSDRSEDALSVLFVGNSLTYTNDLPGAVEELGRLHGQEIRVESVVAPNFSLEDHWIIGDAREALAEGEWDVVVMQQGPSTLASSREHLVRWVGVFADEARDHGTQPAVYMVWPPRGTPIELSEDSYAAAAEAHAAMLLPAGRAWRFAIEQGALFDPYGSDNFHPSRIGTLLAALTVYGGLLELPADLPSSITVGGREVVLEPHTRESLLTAARDALGSVSE